MKKWGRISFPAFFLLLYSFKKLSKNYPFILLGVLFPVRGNPSFAPGSPSRCCCWLPGLSGPCFAVAGFYPGGQVATFSIAGAYPGGQVVTFSIAGDCISDPYAIFQKFRPLVTVRKFPFVLLCVLFWLSCVEFSLNSGYYSRQIRLA